MTIQDFFGTSIGMAVLIILAVQAVLWFLVPFMIFAINRRVKILVNYYLEKDGKQIDAWDGRIKSLEKAA